MNSVGFIGGKFIPLHMGHVYAITKAACMVDELYVVLSHSKERDKSLCENSKIKYIPHTMRFRWLKQLTKDMENVKVIAIEDKYKSDIEYNWEEGAAFIKEAIGKLIHYVFSSEDSYDEIFEKLYPGAKHIVIDGSREKYPISATKIRNDGVFKHWNYIPNIAKPYFIKKVAIVGTESSGKSTLSRYLAKLYNTTYVEEYGRAICDELGGYEGVFTKDIFQYVAYGHKMLEYEAFKEANKVVFIDTEAVVTQYYSELAVNYNNPLLNAIIDSQNYDLWLFLEPDVKWVDDGLRTYGDDISRKEFNSKLKNMLNEKNIQYTTINGTYIERLNRAIELVDKLIDNKQN